MWTSFFFFLIVIRAVTCFLAQKKIIIDSKAKNITELLLGTLEDKDIAESYTAGEATSTFKKVIVDKLCS